MRKSEGINPSPQITSPRFVVMIRTSREAATDNRKMVAAADAAAAICRPLSGASGCCDARYLGLTPQATSLSPLRGLTEWRPVPFWGLTPQAMNLSRLPASPCGLRRDKSALCRRLFDFRPDSLPFAEISIDEITWPLVQAAVANGIEGRLVEADAGCAAANDRFHRRPLRGDATVEPL